MRAPDRLGVPSEYAFPRWAWAVSGTVHAAVLLALLIGPPQWRLPEPPDDPIEIVVINRPPEVAGGGASGGAVGGAAPQAHGAAVGPPAGDAHVSAPAPPKPLPPRPRPSPAPAGPGTAAHDVTGAERILLEGNIVPATPDSAYQNMQPAYPPLASAMGASGTVGLLLHVDPAGLVSSIEVLESSGWPVLDDAATEALSKWHFKPSPGGASFPIRIHFRDPGAP